MEAGVVLEDESDDELPDDSDEGAADALPEAAPLDDDEPPRESVL